MEVRSCPIYEPPDCEPTFYQFQRRRLEGGNKTNRQVSTLAPAFQKESFVSFVFKLLARCQ